MEKHPKTFVAKPRDEIRTILVRKTNITISPPLPTMEICHEKYLTKFKQNNY